MKAIFAALLVLAGPMRLSAAAAAAGPYHVETVAGSGRSIGAVSGSGFGNIQGVTADKSGNLYFSDTDNHRVRKVDSTGVVTTIAGTGTAGYSGDGGPATAAQLNLPYGLAVDAAGTIYVADLGNHRVRRIGADGAITSVAGTGDKRSGGDGGLAITASLMSPRNVALDATGNLYISEFEGHRIRKVASDGTISTIAGTGSPQFGGDNGAAINAQLGYPAGLAFDAKGNLYVADSQNDRIRRIAPDGTITTALGGSWGVGIATPVSVALDSTGGLYVADASATVHVANTAGQWLPFAGTGTQGFSGDGGPAANAALTRPRDLVLDASGRLYIADAARVRRVDTHGVIQTVAGDGATNSVGDLGMATDALLLQPSAVSLDSGGNFFIADSGFARVRQVTASGTIDTAAGTGAPGAGQDNVSASLSALNTPAGVAADGSGNVLIADTNNHRVRLVTPGKMILTLAGTGTAGAGPEYQAASKTGLSSPKGICLDRNGTVYIADTGNNRILRIASTALVEVAAGNGLAGSLGDGGQARQAELSQPVACAVDSGGNLFIADAGNHRIRKVSPGGIISTVAGSGVMGSGGDEGPATAGRLSLPRGVAVDDAGNVFIGDTGNHRVRLVTPDGVIHTIAGQGTAGFSGDGGPASAAQFNSPAGLSLDGSGNIYVADSGNNRVRRLIPDSVVPPGLSAAVSVVNAASMRSGPVAPGEIVTILGKGIGPDTGVAAQFDLTGLLPTTLAGVQAQFDGVLAPLFYVQANQINALVPYTVAAGPSTHLQILLKGQTVVSMDVPVAPAAPGLFPAVVNQDGSFNSQNAPASRGSTVTVYGTGEGMELKPNILGKAAQPPYSSPQLPVGLKIGGVGIQGVSAAVAGGQSGILQVTASVPGAPVASGAAALELTVGSVTAPAITIWLK